MIELEIYWQAPFQPKSGALLALVLNFSHHQPTQLDKYKGAIIQFRPEDERCLTQ